MEKSLFSKIIEGEIPSHKVYEDEKTFAFMDINPIQEGHLLVVPKTQVEFVWDLDSEDYKALMESVKNIACALRKASDKEFVGQQIIGVDVPHAHVHLIPFDTADELKVEPKNNEPNHEKLANMAEKIRKFL